MQHGRVRRLPAATRATRVYAVDTGYGVLDWKLRNDGRVSSWSRTNAMHVELPEPVQIVTIDVSWTRQRTSCRRQNGC